MPFRKCLDYLTFGAIQSLTTLCTKMSLLETRAPLICLFVVGTLIVLRIALLTQRSKREKFDPGFLEKFTSF